MSQLCSATILLVLFLVQTLTKAEYPVKCNPESRSGTSFEPSTDGAKGRYNVQWCMSANLDSVAKDNVVEWQMVVSYSVVRNESNCMKQRAPTKHKHSEVTESFDWHSLNCTNMCFSTQLDLIFTGCYVVENWLPVLGSKRYISTLYIANDLTKASLTDNEVTANYVPHDEYVSIQWHLGNLTASDYDMRLRRTGEEPEVSIKEKCRIASARSNEIVCSLTGLNGTYDVYLTHHTPWKLGDFNGHAFSHYRFESVPRPSTQMSGAGGSLVWLCGVLAVVGAGAAVSAAAWRWRGAARFRKRVLVDWRQRLAESARGPSAGAAAGGPRPVLLLYAREAPVAAPLLAAVTDMLQLAAPGQVYDLFSPEVVAMSAAAPAEWVRTALRRDDVRVVLLQTPALAALYRDCGDSALDSPLLARRCVLRSPAPGDALLALALRLLAAQSSQTALPYTKYYLATVGGLETETLPYTVPFRRYVLPADGPRLLLDLTPATTAPAAAACPGQLAACPGQLAALRTAAEEFSSHVAARPDYLRDHLLLLD